MNLLWQIFKFIFGSIVYWVRFLAFSLIKIWDFYVFVLIFISVALLSGFSHVTKRFYNFFHFFISNSRGAAWVLTANCQYWRNISITLCTFFGYIALDCLFLRKMREI